MSLFNEELDIVHGTRFGRRKPDKGYKPHNIINDVDGHNLSAEDIEDLTPMLRDKRIASAINRFSRQQSENSHSPCPRRQGAEGECR